MKKSKNQNARQDEAERLKMHKFLILIISFVMILANSPVFAQNTDELPQDNQTQAIETTMQDESSPGDEEQNADDIDKLNAEMGLGEQRQIVIDDIESSPNDNEALTKKVVPDTRSELTKMVKMFLKVMLAVAISAVVIFVVLLFVRRFYSPIVTLDDLSADDKERRNSLETPQNKNEALKTFLDKTKEM